MAQLIQTGKTEAIQLHHLKSQHILFLEQTAEEALLKDQGFASVALELVKGVYHKGTVTFSHLFGRKLLPN